MLGDAATVPLVTRAKIGRYSRLWDCLLWLVLVAPGAGQAVANANLGSPWWQLVLGAVALAPIVFMARRLPTTALVVSATICAFEPAFLWAPVAFSALAGRRLDAARPVLLAFAGITAVRGLWFVVVDFDLGVVVETVVAVAFLGLAPWLLGRYRRQQAALTRWGWERAEHLESEQRAVAEQAKLRERARIAEDMHDSLGHELSLLALQAGALELDESLDAQQREAATVIRTRAGKATHDLRSIIDVLRADHLPPTEPSNETLDGLVSRARASGARVNLDSSGSAAQVPEMVRRAAHRVVQEGITNATKHAPGSEIHVRVRHVDRNTEVTITNPVGTVENNDGGRGLAGLRERCRLLGGRLHFGEQNGVFELHVQLPHNASPRPSGNEPSESARQHDRARLQMRRDVTMGIAGLGVLALVMVLGQGAIYLRNGMRAELGPERFGELTVGSHRNELAPLLPEQEAVRDGSGDRPPPSSQWCEVYGSHRNVLHVDYRVYRLCFDQERLVSKEVLPEGDS